VKWLVGALFTASGAIFSATGFLLVKAYGLGKREARLEQISKEIAESKVMIVEAVKKLEAIPLHDQRLGQLEALYRKTHSDIRELLKSAAKLEAREEMRSSGHDLSSEAGG
jgi:hypothetical protein